MAPLVSIIVTCYNQVSYLEKAVGSVLSQTYSNLECIIVDDGSSDQTREVAERLVQQDSRVQYFYKQNGGVSSARNFGLDKARGEWLQFLDGDDWINSDKIRFQLSCVDPMIEENMVLYSDYERVFLDSDQTIVDRQLNVVGSLTQEELITRLLVPDFLVTSPFPALQQCLLMKRSTASRKRFDQRLKALQDRDFPLDLLIMDIPFTYTSIVGAYYTKHQTNQTNQWSHMQKEYILFYELAYSKHPKIYQYTQRGLEYFLDEALREKNFSNFERLSQLTKPPVYLFNHNLQIRNSAFLKLVYGLRLLIPNFLLYEKYRGPRGQKVIALFSKVLLFCQRRFNQSLSLWKLRSQL
ncbi:MAG: glycosyltransferase family 2 protein [Chroococcidiopsidaceae cyanobacterium CP_BM_RX_35]|nr:glycosyltransferase family 2 protein [Chroococcidiopsidaceae cyanobacterium CP_BM_RX_35]